MTSREALQQICSNCEYHLILSQKRCPFRSISNEYCDEYQGLAKDLELLTLYKKFFKYSLTEIQGFKYLVLPNSDIRRPDAMLRITDEEYEILKGELENEK